MTTLWSNSCARKFYIKHFTWLNLEKTFTTNKFQFQFPSILITILKILIHVTFSILCGAEHWISYFFLILPQKWLYKQSILALTFTKFRSNLLNQFKFGSFQNFFDIDYLILFKLLHQLHQNQNKKTNNSPREDCWAELFLIELW